MKRSRFTCCGRSFFRAMGPISDEDGSKTSDEIEENDEEDLVGSAIEDIFFWRKGAAGMDSMGSSRRPSWPSGEGSSAPSRPRKTLDALMRDDEMPNDIRNAEAGVWVMLHRCIGTAADGHLSVYVGNYIPQDMGQLVKRPADEFFVSVKLLSHTIGEESEIYRDLHWQIGRSRTVPSHANVLSINETFMSDEGNLFCVVFPYMNHGPIRHKMLKNFPKGMPEDCILVVLKEAIKGLGCIHQFGIAHGEVCSDHILIAGEPAIKLAFSASAYHPFMESSRPSLPSSPLPIYKKAAAPEIYSPNGNTREYTQAADIWMIGITALELAYGEQPWITAGGRRNLESFIRKITIEKRLPPREAPGSSKQRFYRTQNMIPSWLNSKLKNPSSSTLSTRFGKMVIECLDADPDKRPNAKKLLKMKVFRKSNKNAMHVLS